MPIMSKLTASYLAGLIDGEGYLGFVVNRYYFKKKGLHFYYQPIIKLAMTDLKIPEWLKNSFGGRLEIRKFKNPTHKDSYLWAIQGEILEKILRKISPYLKLKKRQAEILLKKFRIQKKFKGRLSNGQWNKGYMPPYSEAEQKQIQELYLELRKLNQRGKPLHRERLIEATLKKGSDSPNL